jgi:hypothetical protein
MSSFALRAARALREDVDGAPLPAGVRATVLAALVSLGGIALLATSFTPHGLPLHLTTDGVWIGAFAETSRLQEAVLLAVCAAGALSLLTRRRAALELSVWAFVLGTCWGVPVRQHPPPELGVHVPLVLALLLSAAATARLFAHRRRLFAPAPPATWRSELGAGLRVTLALFIVAEFWASMVIRTRHPALLAVVNAEPPPPPPLTGVRPGRRTFATLASSGGNVERETLMPFSAVLEAKLGDRYNFLYSRMGGVNSAKLVAIARDLVSLPLKPDALLFYEGFQDYNYSEGIGVLRAVQAPEGAPGALIRSVVRHSSLVTYLLWRLKKDDCMNTGRNCRDVKVERIFEEFRGNLDRIVALAAEHGLHVFVITLAMDESRVLPDGLKYIATVNDYLRSLPARQPHVTVVDFARRVAERFPDRDVRACEPYELGLTPGECGNQYHLSRKGHALLAELLEPVLSEWASR